eukprot:CAMPEP_0198277732 /NCGR_PEP_ID=MMETSP1447-20131203/66007_1 /TAXON_ID=420782 /ORGANISM="Chaetoceros dichaeta, Strain CCMP1751" /LENGTH=444 /DNA_ID=CAMNT_0043972775 /DNA_START=53 /DNA_END=1387 /DNA_ORIENTATION=+
MMRSQAPISPSPAAGISSSIVGKDLLFTCPVGPKSIAANENEASGLIADFYNKTNGEGNSKANRTVEELTNTVYDGWTKTFKENKKLFYDWKAEQFSTLQSGDVIYESACGEGFNLAMTLQIMKEAGKIENVSVYGNDYIDKSVEVGHYVLEKLAPSGTKIGSLCQGDSSNLHFVPSDSFDLAYTGYIDPIDDPYHLFNTDDDTAEAKNDLCDAKNENGDWAKAKLVDIDQAAQEEWYAKWNLAMTLQIMKEAGKIENISVYGNDYIEKSVEVGHHVLEQLAPTGTKIGALCQGDSSNLYFVPSNSFDLAYTGYIEAITDPYNIFDTDDGYSASDLCKAKIENGDWAKAKLVDIDQAAQEEWYAKWVSELVRIVKPGKPVIIENVARPLCDDVNDWGGVSKKWWKLAVSKYKWDIDVDSIITKELSPGREHRYHVSMRKNAKMI